MLYPLHGQLPEFIGGAQKKEWTFRKNILEKDNSFFRGLLCNYQSLHFNYLVTCSIIAKRSQKNRPDAFLTQTVFEALALSELLEMLYRDYLHIPHEVYPLVNDQACYRNFLAKKEKITFASPPPEQDIKQPLFFSRSIRNFTTNGNLFRLTLTRARRLAVVINNDLAPAAHIKTIVQQMDRFANPVLLNVAWMFFTPRLLNNLAMLAKHLIPGPWLKAQEKDIPFSERVHLQLGRRWFELGNDIAWFSVGLINCFFLAGSASIFLALALQGFDILWAGLLKKVEIGKLQKNHDFFTNALEDPNLSRDEQYTLQKRIKNLDKFIAIEEKKLNLKLLNASLMFVSISLSLPLIAFSPVIPLIGACLALFASGMVYSANQKITSETPKRNINVLCSHNLFSTKPENPPENPDGDNSQKNNTNPYHS